MTRRKAATFAAGASVLALAVSAALIASGFASPNSKPMVGASVDNFMLVDQNGLAWTLKYDKLAPAVVVVTYAVGDPISRDAAKHLATLKATYPSVQFVLLDSVKSDTREAIAAEAKAEGIDIPLLND